MEQNPFDDFGADQSNNGLGAATQAFQNLDPFGSNPNPALPQHPPPGVPSQDPFGAADPFSGGAGGAPAAPDPFSVGGRGGADRPFQAAPAAAPDPFGAGAPFAGSAGPGGGAAPPSSGDPFGQRPPSSGDPFGGSAVGPGQGGGAGDPFFGGGGGPPGGGAFPPPPAADPFGGGGGGASDPFGAPPAQPPPPPPQADPFGGGYGQQQAEDPFAVPAVPAQSTPASLDPFATPSFATSQQSQGRLDTFATAPVRSGNFTGAQASHQTDPFATNNPGVYSLANQPHPAAAHTGNDPFGGGDPFAQGGGNGGDPFAGSGHHHPASQQAFHSTPGGGAPGSLFDDDGFGGGGFDFGAFGAPPQAQAPAPPAKKPSGDRLKKKRSGRKADRAAAPPPPSDGEEDDDDDRGAGEPYSSERFDSRRGGRRGQEDDEDDDDDDDDDGSFDGAGELELQGDGHRGGGGGGSGGREYEVVFHEAKLGMLLERRDEWKPGSEKRFETTTVKMVVEGQAAAARGVTVGSKILTINGQNCLRKTYQETLELVKTLPRPIFVVLEAPRDQEDDTTQGWCLYKSSVAGAPRAYEKWKRRYYVVGGAVARPNVLQTIPTHDWCVCLLLQVEMVPMGIVNPPLVAKHQIYESKTSYEQVVVSMFQQKKITQRVKAWKLTRKFKISGIKSKVYRTRATPVKYFALKSPKSRMKQICFASENMAGIQALYAHTKRFCSSK